MKNSPSPPGVPPAPTNRLPPLPVLPLPPKLPPVSAMLCDRILPPSAMFWSCHELNSLVVVAPAPGGAGRTHGASVAMGEIATSASLTGQDLTLTSLTTAPPRERGVPRYSAAFYVGAPPAIRERQPSPQVCEGRSRKQQEAHMFTNSILRKIILTGAVLGCLASARDASANIYTAPVTAMGVAHCTGGSPGGWKVVPWVRFAG